MNKRFIPIALNFMELGWKFSGLNGALPLREMWRQGVRVDIGADRDLDPRSIQKRLATLQVNGSLSDKPIGSHQVWNDGRNGIRMDYHVVTFIFCNIYYICTFGQGQARTHPTTIPTSIPAILPGSRESHANSGRKICKW